MGEKVTPVELYYPDIANEAMEVIKKYGKLLGTICKIADKEKWTVLYWISVISTITTDIVRELLVMQTKLVNEVKKTLKGGE